MGLLFLDCYENCGRITAMSEEKQEVCLDREVCKDIEEVLTFVIVNYRSAKDRAAS